MSYFEKQFTNVQASGNSDALSCFNLVDKWVVVNSLTGGTAIIQGSRDGTNWSNLTSMTGASSPGDKAYIEVPQPVKQLRINGTSMTGSPTFWLTFDDPHAEGMKSALSG